MSNDDKCSTCPGDKSKSETHPQFVRPDCANLGDVAKMVFDVLGNKEAFIEQLQHTEDEIPIYILPRCIEMYDVFRAHGGNVGQAIAGCILEFASAATVEDWL